MLVCVCPQNLEDIKAREAYLTQQRDRLLKMKNKDSQKNISARSSTSPEPKSTHTSPTHKQDRGHHAHAEGATALQPGERNKQRSSGVLCSAIAGKLKRGHK